MPTIRTAWHGSAAYTLDIAGHRILVDPYFSQAGSYGPWYTPNAHAPALDAYLPAYAPELIIITHGHFDHCDPEAVRALAAARPLPVLTSAEVAAYLRRHDCIAEGDAHPLAPGATWEARGLQVATCAGQHWLTGPEGDAAAAKLDRPERYGVFPAGGPSLGWVLAAGGQRVYLSGDTVLAGVPATPVDAAVVCVGTRMPHPVTKRVEEPVITAADLPAAAVRLQARVVAPVHWDFPLFLEPLDLRELERRMAERAPACRVVYPRYNDWVDLLP